MSTTVTVAREKIIKSGTYTTIAATIDGTTTDAGHTGFTKWLRAGLAMVQATSGGTYEVLTTSNYTHFKGFLIEPLHIDEFSADVSSNILWDCKLIDKSQSPNWTTAIESLDFYKKHFTDVTEFDS